jgi:Uncharacterized protein conserved in bacteria
MTKPRSLQLLLGTGTTARLLEHVRHLQSVNEQLRACIDAEAASHIQVADLSVDRLLIHADSAAWATRLRYLTPQILRCLQQTPSLMTLHRIDIRVSPLAQPPVRTLHPVVLSRTSAVVLETAAADLSDPALRDALQRLARRGRNTPDS